jgi:hypothetical protein
MLFKRNYSSCSECGKPVFVSVSGRVIAIKPSSKIGHLNEIGIVTHLGERKGSAGFGCGRLAWTTSWPGRNGGEIIVKTEVKSNFPSRHWHWHTSVKVTANGALDHVPGHPDSARERLVHLLAGGVRLVFSLKFDWLWPYILFIWLSKLSKKYNIYWIYIFYLWSPKKKSSSKSPPKNGGSAVYN